MKKFAWLGLLILSCCTNPRGYDNGEYYNPSYYNDDGQQKDQHHNGEQK